MSCGTAEGTEEDHFYYVHVAWPGSSVFTSKMEKVSQAIVLKAFAFSSGHLDCKSFLQCVSKPYIPRIFGSHISQVIDSIVENRGNLPKDLVSPLSAFAKKSTGDALRFCLENLSLVDLMIQVKAVPSS